MFTAHLETQVVRRREDLGDLPAHTLTARALPLDHGPAVAPSGSDPSV